MDAEGPPPTLADVLDHTPTDFVGGITVAKVQVRLGDRKGDVPQLRANWPGELSVPLDVFQAAKPFRSNGEDGLFLVIEAQGDTSREALLGRSAQVGIRLGDALVEFSPDSGSFDRAVTLPGVSLRPGDRVEYVLSGSQVLTSSVSGTLATTWDGEFPILLSDGPNRLEVRALRGADREALLKRRLEALDRAFDEDCANASIDPNREVSAWSIRHGSVVDHLEDVASIAGWSDARVQSRIRRRDVVDLDWTTHLADMYAEVEPTVPPFGTAVAWGDSTLRVEKAVECVTGSPEGSCTVTLTFDGGSPDTDEADQPALLSTGEAAFLDAVTEEGHELRLTWSGPQPASGTTVFYRPYGADGWLRLR